MSAAIEVGQNIVIDGDVLEIVSIKGRWVKLSDDRNISRAEAAEGREEYIEDEELLGDELDDEEGDEGRSIVNRVYRETYVKVRREDGRRSMDCGDAVATALRSLTLARVLELVYSAAPELDGRWTGLNNGQKSMNARNALRRMIKAGTLTLAQLG
jgi:hypothetical protein